MANSGRLLRYRQIQLIGDYLHQFDRLTWRQGSRYALFGISTTARKLRPS